MPFEGLCDCKKRFVVHTLLDLNFYLLMMSGTFRSPFGHCAHTSGFAAALFLLRSHLERHQNWVSTHSFYFISTNSFPNQSAVVHFQVWAALLFLWIALLLLRSHFFFWGLHFSFPFSFSTELPRIIFFWVILLSGP